MTGKQKPRLLLVEDEPLLIRALTRALRGRLDVVGAVDGDVARELLQNQPFDAILSEVSIYDSGGRRFVEWLAQTEPRWIPRLILTSGGRDQSMAMDLQERHGCPLLQKPADAAAIADAVNLRIQALAGT